MKIEELIKGGQSECIAWASCKDGIHTDVFETVCAMANTAGGDILLGVNENGSICGLPQRSVGEFVKGLIRAFENPDNFEPILHLLPRAVVAEGKYLIAIHVPESAEVHAMRGKVYVRKQNRTVPVFQTNQLAVIYMKKNRQYSERKILPYLKTSDLNMELLGKLQNRIKTLNPAHPWAELSTEILLEEMNLYGTDYETGVRGLRFAAAILLGKESTIRNAFAQTTICIEDARSGVVKRSWLETNIWEIREQLIKILAEKMEKTEALQYVNKLLLQREYTDMSPVTITITESEVTDDRKEIEEAKGNPILERIFREAQMNLPDVVVSEETPAPVVETVVETEKPMEVKKSKEVDAKMETVKKPTEVVVQQELPFVKSELDLHTEAFTPEERRNAILEMMRENEHVGISVMVRHLKVTKRTILRDIDKLKKEGMVTREGSEKSGKWHLNC